jgi:hypothetical protein
MRHQPAMDLPSRSATCFRDHSRGCFNACVGSAADPRAGLGRGNAKTVSLSHKQSSATISARDWFPESSPTPSFFRRLRARLHSRSSRKASESHAMLNELSINPFSHQRRRHLDAIGADKHYHCSCCCGAADTIAPTVVKLPFPRCWSMAAYIARAHAA